MELNEVDEVMDLSGAAVVEGPLRIGLAPPALAPTTLTPTLSQRERVGVREQKEGEKSKRREYKVTLIAAGFVRRRDGQPSDFYISAEALRQAGPLFQAVAVFVDHAPEGVCCPSKARSSSICTGSGSIFISPCSNAAIRAWIAACLVALAV